MKFTYLKGATPIDTDEAKSLIPSGVATQTDLNELEEANILTAEKWAFERKKSDYHTINFIKRVHRMMFDNVWKWAGEFRQTNKNLGVDKSQIVIELKKLTDDVSYWIEHQTYPWNELGARFHHRLVSIHPFPNGNGRHARLMTDVVLFQNGEKRFSWGSGPITPEGGTRENYLRALKAADRGEYGLLIAFSRSGLN